MQWTPRGVHQLMRLRTRVLDGTLECDFQRWRKGREAPSSELASVA